MYKNTKFLGCILLAASLFGACAVQETVSDKGSKGKPAASAEIDTAAEEISANGTDHTEQEESEETEKTSSEPLSITLTATGDCTLGNTQTQSYPGSFYSYYDSKGETHFFDGVREVFAADDLTLVNLECVLTDSKDRVEKEFNLKGKPEYVGIMTSSSVEACSLGNNHIRDYKEGGVEDTKKALENAGILYGYNDHVGFFTAENGLRVALISSDVLSQAAQYEDYIRDGIDNVKGMVDLIVVSVHWGVEREYYPTDYQKDLAHKIVDWGADLVIGNHPHVLQGIECYKGKIICYSLGNFCFGANKNPSDKNTMMYQQTFSFLDGELLPEVDAKILPCTVSSAGGYNDFQPTIVEGDKKREIISKVNKYSEPYSDLSIDGNGVIALK